MPIKKKRRRKKRGHYSRGLHISPIAGECKYRSGWEQKYMTYLDSNPDVITWSYEKLVIEYVSNQRTKKIRKYYPDFQVEFSNGTRIVVEIKPSRKLRQATIMKKMKAAQEWCAINGATYKILTEIELKDMGLL